MNKKLYLIVFSVTVFIAFFVRIYQLSSLPPSLNWDEVSFGYNAYSILKTGRDEFGTFMPLYFRSLDDFKLPVYMYMTAASISVFGYNDFAVRFPSAFTGSLSVIIVFFLVRELILIASLKKKKEVEISTTYIFIPLISMITIALLPWNIQFSRMAAEANAGLFFFIFGVFSAIKAVRVGRKWALFTVVSFGLAAYSYLTFRVLVACMFPVFLFLYGRDIYNKTRLTIRYLTIVLSLFFIIALSVELFGGGAHIRYSGSNVFDNNYEYEIALKQMKYDAIKGINIPRRIYHDSEIFTSAMIVFRGYLSHFSPEFLFFDSEAKHHHAPGVGLLYIFMIPFIPIGIFLSLKYFGTKGFILLSSWMLFSPVAAAFTRDIPHAIRAIGMSIPLGIYFGTGIYGSVQYMHKKSKYYAFGLLVALFASIVLFLGHYVHQYTIHLPHEQSDKWAYGQESVMKFISQHHDEYEKVLVSSKLPWPHSFYLYYAKVDPMRYLKYGGTKSGGWENNWNSYENIYFKNFDTKKDRTTDNMLFVGLPSEFLSTVNPVFESRFLNHQPAVYVVDGNDSAIH